MNRSSLGQSIADILHALRQPPYPTAEAILSSFIVAAIVVWIGRRVLDRMVAALDLVDAENRAAVQRRGRQLIGALELFAYGAAAIAGVMLALNEFGIRTSWRPRYLIDWVVLHGINVAIILAGAYITARAIHLSIEHLQFKVTAGDRAGDLEWRRRATTLGSLGTNLVSAVVGFIALLMVLRELTVDIVPILTGAGIAGLAVGFGAQNLVRDVISGFFLILEDQVRVGDHARINGVAGVVEQVNLRTIVLRDFEGAVQVFPNGTITALANLSKSFSFAVVDVAVAYDELYERVTGTVVEIGERMQADPALGRLILEPLEVLGFQSIADAHSTLRIRFKTVPLHQAAVAAELRRRVVSEFARRGIKPIARR